MVRRSAKVKIAVRAFVLEALLTLRTVQFRRGDAPWRDRRSYRWAYATKTLAFEIPSMSSGANELFRDRAPMRLFLSLNFSISSEALERTLNKQLFTAPGGRYYLR